MIMQRNGDEQQLGGEDANNKTNQRRHSLIRAAHIEPAVGNPPTSKWCTISGDPHIKTFDSTGKRWHPMHAPGHWWLVKTKGNKVSIQALYSGCGVAGNGGWQDAKLNEVPRTCTSGIAVGGSFITGSDGEPGTLVVLAACDWNYETSACRNSDTEARVTWNKQPTSLTRDQNKQLNDKISVKDEDKKLHITLPDGGKIVLWKTGRFNNNPYSIFNLHIFLPHYDVQYCGHCGNFDNDPTDDDMYEQDGLLKNGKRYTFCDAAVHCRDRLIKGGKFGSYAKGRNTEKCKENPPGVAFDLGDCPTHKRNAARTLCLELFKADHLHLVSELDKGAFDDCVLDACLSKEFAKIDADDEVNEDKEGCGR